MSGSARAQPSLSAVEGPGRHPAWAEPAISRAWHLPVFPTAPPMSASSQPELNSQRSTPFGWPDVSAAQLPAFITPETPKTHRTGYNPGSLA